jgi:glycosyltransferase involved in cell wall biosynthesis
MRIGLELSTTQFNAAGTARYSLELARALREGGFAGLELVELRAGSWRQPEPGLARKSLVLWWEWFYCPILLPHRAQRLKLDAVHCTAPMPIPAQLRTITSLHDVIPLEHPEWFPPLMRWRLQRWIRSARRARVVIASSAYTQAQGRAHLGLPTERLRVVPLGLRVTPPTRQALAEAYILAVGTLEPRKNLATTLRAYALLRRRWIAAPRLKIIGGQGWGGVKVQAMLEQLDLCGVVEVLGHVPDEMLWQLYANAECLVFPSLSEGFGFPPLEAMACGCPAIVANVASLPEVVGDAALLVEPHDTEAVAAALHRVLSDRPLADELRARGRVRAAAFTWERCAHETVGVYRQALDA